MTDIPAAAHDAMHLLARKLEAIDAEVAKLRKQRRAIETELIDLVSERRGIGPGARVRVWKDLAGTVRPRDPLEMSGPGWVGVRLDAHPGEVRFYKAEYVEPLAPGPEVSPSLRCRACGGAVIRTDDGSILPPCHAGAGTTEPWTR